MITRDVNIEILAEQRVNRRETILSLEENRHKSQGRRLELPTFNGEDLCGWLLKAEWYFFVKEIVDLKNCHR